MIRIHEWEKSSKSTKNSKNCNDNYGTAGREDILGGADVAKVLLKEEVIFDKLQLV